MAGPQTGPAINYDGGSFRGAPARVSILATDERRMNTDSWERTHPRRPNLLILIGVHALLEP